MKTRWPPQQEAIGATAGKSPTGGLLFVFAMAAAVVCLPPTTSGQVSPRTPSDGPFLDSSQYRFRVSGASGERRIVEASTDLANWTPVFTNTISTSGFFDFFDAQ